MPPTQQRSQAAGLLPFVGAARAAQSALPAALSPASSSCRAALEKGPGGSKTRARNLALRSSWGAPAAPLPPPHPPLAKVSAACIPPGFRCALGQSRAACAATAATHTHTHTHTHSRARPPSLPPLPSSLISRSVLLLVVRVPTPRPAICHQLSLHWRGAESGGEGGGVGRGREGGGNCLEPSLRAAVGAAAAAADASGSSLGPSPPPCAGYWERRGPCCRSWRLCFRYAAVPAGRAAGGVGQAAPGPFVPRAAAGPGCAPGKGGAAPRGRLLRRHEAWAVRRDRAAGANQSPAPLLAGRKGANPGPPLLLQRGRASSRRVFLGSRRLR